MKELISLSGSWRSSVLGSAAFCRATERNTGIHCLQIKKTKMIVSILKSAPALAHQPTPYSTAAKATSITPKCVHFEHTTAPWRVAGVTTGAVHVLPSSPSPVITYKRRKDDPRKISGLITAVACDCFLRPVTNKPCIWLETILKLPKQKNCEGCISCWCCAIWFVLQLRTSLCSRRCQKLTS